MNNHKSAQSSEVPQGKQEGRISQDTATPTARTNQADNRIETVTVICCNCYQDREVGLSSLGADIKKFYNDHRTRIGRRFCKLEDIGMNRYLYAVSDLRLDDSEAKSGSDTSPSNGGGSQDSIDTAYELAYKILRPYDVKMAVVDEVAARLTAWHNTQLKAVQQRADKYDELIMAVGTKYEGETRHQTALRYIHQAENQDNPPMQSNLEKKNNDQ